MQFYTWLFISNYCKNHGNKLVMTQVLLHTSMGITTYLDPYSEVKAMGTTVTSNDSSVTT